jgi:hypothetical protein
MAAANASIVSILVRSLTKILQVYIDIFFGNEESFQYFSDLNLFYIQLRKAHWPQTPQEENAAA